MNIEPSKKLAYWVGVFQADGCLAKSKIKNRKNLRYRVGLKVGRKSIPMLLKFQDISNEIFKRNNKIYYEKKAGIWSYYMGVNSILGIFDTLDIKTKGPPNPSFWIIENKAYFGSYIAGLIDGDGDIRIKRPKYPQCAIRISCGQTPKELSKSIRDKMGCSTWMVYRKIKSKIDGRGVCGESFSLEFLVSSKNYNFIKDFIISEITLKYKRDKIKNYITTRWPV